MKESYEKLLRANKEWAQQKVQDDPKYFSHLNSGQAPEYLWIGCSDSRVPANEVTGTMPGEIFVHRNIANLVIHTDHNALSVLEYAVAVLKVKHIIVCGHYNCGGVKAAMDSSEYGYVDNWLRNIKEIYNKNSKELEAITNYDARFDRLVELNIVEQVRNLAKTKVVQKAWRERELQIHGWVFGMDDGIIKELDTVYDEPTDLEPIFRYTFRG